MGEDRKCRGFWWESQKERDHLKDQGVDGMMGSECILGGLDGGVEWIQLAQDRSRLWAVVNAVNLGVLAPRSLLEYDNFVCLSVGLSLCPL
jgi:hypothetical protein